MSYNDGRTINVLALVKDGERYIFLYDDNNSKELLNTLGRYAADEELSFTWYDAGILSQKVKVFEKENRDLTIKKEVEGLKFKRNLEGFFK